MREIQQYYLQLAKKVIVPATKRTGDAVKQKYVAAFALNMQSLGFMPSQNLLNVLNNLSYDEFVSVADDINAALVKLAGERTNMNPMYPDFPNIMMTISDETLFVDAFIHYYTRGEWEARFVEKLKVTTESLLKLKTIGLGSESDLMNYIPMLANSSVSLSMSQKEMLEHLTLYFKNQRNISVFLQQELNMTNKENITYLIHMLYKKANLQTCAKTVAYNHISTSTDVLRLIVGFLGGDVSLSTHNHDFKSLKRIERRFLLQTLNKVCKTNKQILEDASRYQGLWLVVGELLHPGDYADRYPKAYSFFHFLRNNKVRSWYSNVEKAYDSNDTQSLIALLKTRPGEFARRLERTMRHVAKNSGNVIEVINEFGTIADKVDSTILLQMAQFFEDKYIKPSNTRTFFPKGNTAKAYTMEDTRDSLNLFYYAMASRTCREALVLKFSDKESLGKVYIDPAIEGYVVPLKMRNASRQLISMGRGSRVKLPEEANVLRLYTWWKNPGHTDLDLSAIFLDKDYGHLLDVAYYDLRSKEYGAYHSGDIRSAVNGAAEFIDLDIAKAKEKGVKYIVMGLCSFSSEPFYELTECFAGVMVMDEVKAHEKTFDPAKSIVRSDITADSKNTIPYVYDVETHELIWLDIAMNTYIEYCDDVDINRNVFVNTVKGMMNASYPNFATLAALHTQARATEIVDNPEEADVIFSLDKGITPFSIEDINANWL